FWITVIIHFCVCLITVKVHEGLVLGILCGKAGGRGEKRIHPELRENKGGRGEKHGIHPKLQENKGGRGEKHGNHPELLENKRGQGEKCEIISNPGNKVEHEHKRKQLITL
ncbi:MAG: hypothetical protein Q8935_24960, partial [Bacillota bacterium]|nr:hypothetical protein [Bacillota bacterium]